MSAIRFTYVGLGIAAVAGWAAVACSSDSGASAPPGGGNGGGIIVGGGGGPAGNGGFPASGGVNPGGGAPPANGGAPPGNGGAPVGNGGGVTVTPTDITITGSVTQCTGTTPAAIPATLTATSCTLPQCNHATCVEKSLINSFAPTITDTDLALLGTCGSASIYCVPNDFIATTGQFQTKHCTSLIGAEGRCISTCVPQVLTQITTLPQADCAADERCAPCWNPIDGTNTGACDQGCDTGTTETPKVFPKCGMDKGLCVPTSLVPPDLQAAVPVDTCTGSGEVCAPIEKAKDLNYQFPKCWNAGLSGLAMANTAGQKFACVPTYIVPEAQRPLLNSGETVPPDNFPPCATGELCAPCFNPLSTPTPNMPTGACDP